MTLQDRDYVTGKHPPYCTCAACVDARLERMNRPGLLKRIFNKIFRR